MTLYSLRQLKYHFNHRLVLDIGHLDIEAGTVIALLGPNGAGKTTLLNILGFLEIPSSGSLIFQGQAVDGVKKALAILRRQVVVVDQHPIMFSTRVCDNIAFGLKIRSLTRKERERIIDEVLDLVGLNRYKNAYAPELSGGETQRLALARALALKPPVLLCDEPTASVDAENQTIIINLLRQINSERGTTILFTTHDRLQAASLARQTLVLEQGRVVETSAENSFLCPIHPTAAGHQICLPGQEQILFVPQLTTVQKMRKTVRVIIAPDKIELQRRAIAPLLPTQTASTSCLSGRVIMVMADGDKVRVMVNIGLMLVVLMTNEEYRMQQPAVGDAVTLLIPGDALCIIHPGIE